MGQGVYFHTYQVDQHLPAAPHVDIVKWGEYYHWPESVIPDL